jgi:uncharacterized protein YlaI
MLVATGTPDREPGPRMYVCPGCKTRIPFGTETSEPPDNCPKCRRRLYIPTIVGAETRGRARDERDEQPDESIQVVPVPSRQSKVRDALLIVLILLAVGLMIILGAQLI